MKRERADCVRGSANDSNRDTRRTQQRWSEKGTTREPCDRKERHSNEIISCVNYPYTSVLLFVEQFSTACLLQATHSGSSHHGQVSIIVIWQVRRSVISIVCNMSNSHECTGVNEEALQVLTVVDKNLYFVTTSLVRIYYNHMICIGHCKSRTLCLNMQWVRMIKSLSP